jgi:hypothetical protein
MDMFFKLRHLSAQFEPPAGLDWDFFPSSDSTVRLVSLLIAVGGSFITALLLGIVSGVCVCV